MSNSNTHPFVGDDWNRSERMDFLYNTFRHRSINPVGYDRKMAFWCDSIPKSAFHFNDAVVTTSSLIDRYRRSPDTQVCSPKCIPDVIAHMLSRGEITPMSEFMKDQSQGWLGWGVSLLAKPVTSYVWGSGDPVTGNGVTDEIKYVYVPVAESIANKVMKKFEQWFDTECTDGHRFTTYEKLWQLCLNICANKDSFDCSLKILERRNDIAMDVVNKLKIVKLADQNKRDLKITESERSIVEIEETISRLQTDVDAVNNSCDSLKISAVKAHRAGQKKRALTFMRQFKQKESLADKKIGQIYNLEDTLHQLEHAASHGEVLNAMRGAASVLRGNINVSQVDKTMDEIHEALGDMTDVNESISTPIGDRYDEIDLSNELDELLADSPAPCMPLPSDTSTPKIPTGIKYPKIPRDLPRSDSLNEADDLERRLRKLREPV